jgi:glycosyltransferase involved in cell wall biosynthesis
LLARELARLGDVAQVVVTGRGSELSTRLAEDGVPVRPVTWRMGLDPRVLPALTAALAGEAVVVHAHDAHAVTLAGAAALLRRRPLVATRRVDFPLRRRGFWGRATRVIAISDAVAEVLAADGIGRERITVVHSGVDLAAVRRTTRLGIRERLGLPPGTVVLANVAALVPHKDHATLLRTAAAVAGRLPDAHWVVAGAGPEREALERLRSTLGLERRVHLLGQVEEPARLIADADCFVMSSCEEGLGTAVLDAMALGIAVASTSAGGLPEMLKDGAGVLAPPRDPVALADAVARLVSAPDFARDTVRRATLAVERFTARRMAEAVRSVYRSCVSFP